MTEFALIGAAGFVAPRHMRAIKELSGQIVAAVDPSDSVGVIDSYFPGARFFTEFERFDRHIDKLRRSGQGVEYITVCSPNYLHDAHVRFALRSEAHVICEKPLVLNPWNLDGLEAIEQQSDFSVSTILQLRLHPTIVKLKEKIDREPADHVFDVDLSYITSRGAWYHVSWKGDDSKSGGIATNIGVHFFDLLGYLFGSLKENIVHHRTNTYAAGYLEFQRARVRWFMSVDAGDLPKGTPDGQMTYRSITVGGEEVEFSSGFTDLHTRSYEEILAGNGFGINAVRPSIELVSRIRTADLTPNEGDAHPFLASKN